MAEAEKKDPGRTKRWKMLGALVFVLIGAAALILVPLARASTTASGASEALLQ